AHKNEERILRTLTIQMLLPFVYGVSVVVWLLDVAGIFKSEALRRSVLTTTSFVSLLTPLVTIYYFPMYKRYTYEKLVCLPNSHVDTFRSSNNR
ncbi:hypothetical protein PFISCL1PPCAC_12976, partial [Pristionchus fissidentatus]